MFSELIYNMVSYLERLFLNCLTYVLIEFANKIKPLIYTNDNPKVYLMFSEELLYNKVYYLEKLFLNCVPYVLIEFANKIKPLIYINDIPKVPPSGCTTIHNYLLNNYTLLDENNTNKNIDIDEINNYTVINNISLKSIKLNEDASKMSYNILKCLLDSGLIHCNGKIITDINKCIIMDFLYSKNVTFGSVHTDLNYDWILSQAFNVWYLIENNEDYGNMFLLETDEYDKSYTPCKLDDYYNSDDKHISVNKASITEKLLQYSKKLGTLNLEKIKPKYLNIKNGECLVMTKHLLHITDLRRTNNVNAVNFRVVIKNDDGSIYHSGNKFAMRSNHTYDASSKKLFNVNMFDLI